MNKFKYDLQQAMVRLDGLLKAKILPEDVFQDFFENNPVVFQIMGYTEWHSFTKNSGKELPRDEYSNLKPEPDFIVKTKQNLYEIFEIKTPCSKKLIIESNEYREKFTEEISSYVSQTIKYENYFTRNPANRKKVKAINNIPIQEDLDIKIVVGLDAYVDKTKLHQQCRRLAYKIDILTYDDILNILKSEYSKEYSLSEYLPGLSFHMIARLYENKSGIDQYILDIGEDEFQNRISLYLNKRSDLCFKVIDDSSKENEVSIDLGSDNYFNKWIYLVCEFGLHANGYYMSASVNGYEKDIRQKDVKLSTNIHVQRMFLGCNLKHTNFAKFDIAEKFAFGHTLAYDEKFSMLYYVSKEYDDYRKVLSWIEFDGTKFMMRSTKGDLIQDDPKFCPVFRKIHV